jgi:hypothetical protein
MSFGGGAVRQWSFYLVNSIIFYVSRALYLLSHRFVVILCTTPMNLFPAISLSFDQLQHPRVVIFSGLCLSVCLPPLKIPSPPAAAATIFRLPLPRRR